MGHMMTHRFLQGPLSGGSLRVITRVLLTETCSLILMIVQAGPRFISKSQNARWVKGSGRPEASVLWVALDREERAGVQVYFQEKS